MKVTLKLGASAFCVMLLVTAQDALALTNLKKIQVTDNSQVDLFFDTKVNPAQIKTEFFNDIIQISLTDTAADTAVYPAKISSVSGSELTKVFAYQYAPKLVRCRLTVKGKAEAFQDKLQIKATGKLLSVKLGGAHVSDQISLNSARAERVDQSPAAKADEKSGMKINDEEKQLLERVLKATAGPAQLPSKEAKDSKDAKDSRDGAKDAKDGAKELTKEGREREKERDRPITGNNKPLPSPLKSFAMLGMVLAIFLGLAFAVKRARSQSLLRNKGLGKFLGSFGKLGLGKKEKMIEVVATHYLGPKKSIAVVKIAGRHLVLGVSNESINLITQLQPGQSLDDSDVDLDDLALGLGLGGNPSKEGPAMSQHSTTMGGMGAMSAGAPMFSDILSHEAAKPAYGPRAGYQAPAASAAPAAGPAIGAPAGASAAASVRAQIRSKLGAMKPL
jgi:flagellar biogenesis protein FliO